MLFGETLQVALTALRANKLRSLLTMLGIVIGVAAVIAMVALGSGAQASVRERIAALGTTLVTVVPGQMRFGGGIASMSDRAALTMDDAAAIEEGATRITAVQPEMSRSLQVQREGRNTNTTINGVTPNYLEVRRFQIQHGRMFTAGDDAARRRYAVLGPQVVADLGVSSGEALVGETIRIGSIQFEVIGVLASKGQGAGFGNPDDQVLIPLQTARYRVIGSERLRAIHVLARSEEEITHAMAEIRRILRREHRLRSGVADDFSIRTQADFLNTLGETTQIFTMLLASIAFVSLVVGGIGIMNIMLVSVTERTREIGVRKAVGATRGDIMLQFLIEALVLCLLGGAVGLALGVGVAQLGRVLLQWNTQVGATSVVIALAFSAAVGLAFGVWPARRAARLDPIESLRYE
uniref:FtsX-like permease family protein n=1 Tax=Eiseniibacteriota bacterium TaxID=2212470 RepID=A0A832I2C9_UNCEI